MNRRMKYLAALLLTAVAALFATAANVAQGNSESDKLVIWGFILIVWGVAQFAIWMEDE